MLRYLKQSGMSKEDILNAYVVFVRSVAEYAVPAFHPMMTKSQKVNLEKQKCNALKIIYGFNHTYKEMLELSGLDTLEARRQTLTDNFAVKMKNNPKYSHLFPERPQEQRRARRGNKYVEYAASTNRLYNSPLYHMRRRLNSLERRDAEAGSAGVRAAPNARNNNNIRCDFLYDEWM